MQELSKAYDPSLVENKWYAEWLKQGCFTADPSCAFNGHGLTAGQKTAGGRPGMPRSGTPYTIRRLSAGFVAAGQFRISNNTVLSGQQLAPFRPVLPPKTVGCLWVAKRTTASRSCPSGTPATQNHGPTPKTGGAADRFAAAKRKFSARYLGLHGTISGVRPHRSVASSAAD